MTDLFANKLADSDQKNSEQPRRKARRMAPSKQKTFAEGLFPTYDLSHILAHPGNCSEKLMLLNYYI